MAFFATRIDFFAYLRYNDGGIFKERLCERGGHDAILAKRVALLARALFSAEMLGVPHALGLARALGVR
jgi:hypothetical protein